MPPLVPSGGRIDRALRADLTQRWSTYGANQSAANRARLCESRQHKVLIVQIFHDYWRVQRRFEADVYRAFSK
jgi:hypothetical protein